MGRFYTEGLRIAATALSAATLTNGIARGPISRSPANCRACQQPMGSAHTNNCRFAPFVAGHADAAFNVKVHTGTMRAAYNTKGTDSAAVHMAAVDLFGVCAITVKPAARAAC